MKVSSRLLSASAISLLAGAAYADESSATGFWVTPNHGAVVNIAPCDGGLCGHLVGLRTDRNPGDVPRDVHNSDTAKRNTSICGLGIMGDLKPVKGSPIKWQGGWVYDPESGSTYQAEMRLDGSDRLKLRGYLGISLFGQTQEWTRETAEIKNRCTPPKRG
ncbi:MAG: hypothetical protein JWM91_3606 [Rhodospirillales bacterium]|nr:hypothetical protein [Rhodospirillales bacterium]